MYQIYGIRGCKSWCEYFSSNCFCILRNRHSQRSDNSVASLGSQSISFPFRTELVAENAIFGTQQGVWKERLWCKSVLEENIRTVPFITGVSLRLLCVWNFVQSSEWQASGTVLRLPAKKNYIDADFTFPLPVWSECTASSLRTIKACELFHTNFNAQIYIAHQNIFVLVSALQKIQNVSFMIDFPCNIS
jgi:hypothetical protein